MVSVLPSEFEFIRDVPVISRLVSGVPPPNLDEEERESIGERSVATVTLLIARRRAVRRRQGQQTQVGAPVNGEYVEGLSQRSP